ncbi:hypothetical protein [Blastococcus sp. URHD0036]|uniref:hypothetical protein n=1 Tax=Blastococcus sp. URHD0036 TaxID=1380356 RepID=UPI0012DD5E2F|nr:hypothetical protein [Blastococcus sp. URHD0036]
MSRNFLVVGRVQCSRRAVRRRPKSRGTTMTEPVLEPTVITQGISFLRGVLGTD